jgi:hypothetical protein
LSRVRILSVFVALIALTAAFAACGGGSDDPQSIVDDATLQGIESAAIDLTLDAKVQGEKGGKVDVKLSGPFQSEDGADLPELDLAFSSKGSLGGKDLNREGGVTLLGNKAYVSYEGTEYAVDSTTFAFAKSLLKQQGGGGQSSEISACQDAAGDLDLADFVDGLKDEGSAEVGGTSTTKVSGNLDVSSAIDAVSKLVEDPACSEQLKAAGPIPSAAELDKAKSTVRDSVKSAHADLYVGDDHIVRRITAQVTIEPKDSKAGAKRVDLDLDLTLTGVNEEQTISAPANTKPLSDLFLKLNINPIELLGAFQNGGGVSGLGDLLERLGEAGGGSSGGGGGGNSGGGQESYYECLGEANTAVDVQDCTGLLQ